MRKVFAGLVSLVLISCFVSAAFAGTTGKISGVVTDGDSKEPLPGANVVVDGTSMGAASNLDGQFVILNVPPGVYTLKTTMMGFTTQIVQEVRVSIDMTAKVNFTLSETVLESGQEVTIVAERPLVKMDMTSSLSSVGAEEIADLPVQSVSDVLELQAGIVRSGGLHIRGGRSGEVAYWVDGVATTDAFNNNSTAAIENSAVQELQVISGTFNAEYGQAMSGIINIITKDGGSQYHGQIKGYVGDYLSADDQYSVMKSVKAIEDEETGNISLLTDAEDPLQNFNPIYNGEYSLSGPIPGMGDKVTFFTNARYYTNEGYLYGREWFLPSGVPGDSSLVPMNPHRRWSALGKITWKPTGNMKITYSYNISDWKNDRYFDRSYKYVPGGVPQSMGNTQTHLLSLNHVLSPKTFYELKINRMETQYESYVHENSSLIPTWLVHVPADSTTPEMTFDPTTEEGELLLRELQELGLQYEFVADPENAVGYVHQDSARTPTSYSYFRSGNSLNRTYRNSAYWIAKFDLTSQVNNTHLVKFGFEGRLHELSLDSYRLLPASDELGQEIVPFIPTVPGVDNLYRDSYTRKPREFSAYIQDKLELKDLIINIGLRYDYFDANSVVPTNPRDINIYAPFLDENKYKNPGAPEDELVEYTPEERRAFMHTKVDPKMSLSPRLGIAYPITDKGVIHFSYGHFLQIPEFQRLYDSPDFKLNTGGSQTIIGNADLESQRTTQYEIGLQQELMPGVGIDATIFYRDIRDWVGTSPLIPTARDVVKYSIYENKDYANVRGFTFKAEGRMSNNLTVKVDYMAQVAEGTYSNPNDAFNAAINENEPRRNLIPLNWDQRHTLNGQLIYRYGGWSASLVGKYRTGLPYTPSFAKGEVVGGTALSALPENSSRRPIVTSVDLYLTKEFKLNSLRCTFFTYVYNLFDNRAATAVFADTGSPTYTTYPIYSEVPYASERISTVEDLYSRPDWYIAPRQVQVGFSLGF